MVQIKQTPIQFTSSLWHSQISTLFLYRSDVNVSLLQPLHLLLNSMPLIWPSAPLNQWKIETQHHSAQYRQIMCFPTTLHRSSLPSCCHLAQRTFWMGVVCSSLCWFDDIELSVSVMRVNCVENDPSKYMSNLWQVTQCQGIVVDRSTSFGNCSTFLAPFNTFKNFTHPHWQSLWDKNLQKEATIAIEFITDVSMGSLAIVGQPFTKINSVLEEKLI